MDSRPQIQILFGTVSGNGEMVADELALFLIGSGYDTVVHDIACVDLHRLDFDALYIVICSTHGDGDVAWPVYGFYRAVRDRVVSVRGLRYAIFGLGDSNYIYSYGVGSDFVDEALRAGGALRVGEYGRHDAATGTDPSDVAISWASSLVHAAYRR